MAVIGSLTAVLVMWPYSLFMWEVLGAAHAKITDFWALFGWGLLLLMTWVLGACGAGMIAGGVAGLVGRALRVRTGVSLGVRIAIGLIAIAGLYAYYTFWVLQVRGESLQLLTPLAIYTQLQEHLSSRATNGKVFAWISYGIEATFFLGGVWASLKELTGRPYCESCERWTERLSAVARLELPSKADPFFDRLGEGEVAAVLELAPASPGDERCLQLDFDLCPGCVDSSYLTLRDAKHDPELEPTAWESFQAVRKLTSARGVAGFLGEGFVQGIQEEDLAERLEVDAAFVRHYLPDLSRDQ
jgi:hypothetical protein